MGRQNTSQALLKAGLPALDGFGLAAPVKPADIKRALDVAISLGLVVLLLPVLALVSLAIVLDSRGPLLFCQRRTGLNGKTFGILKFRSMHVMEDGAEVVQATARRRPHHPRRPYYPQALASTSCRSSSTSSPATCRW